MPMTRLGGITQLTNFWRAEKSPFTVSRSGQGSIGQSARNPLAIQRDC